LKLRVPAFTVVSPINVTLFLSSSKTSISTSSESYWMGMGCWSTLSQSGYFPASSHVWVCCLKSPRVTRTKGSYSPSYSTSRVSSALQILSQM
jgi:hypothetical protein